MIISKKAIPRRAVLRGLGATVALPLLDGMVPALTALSQTAARPVRRLGAIYVPNGMDLGRWTPTTDGSAFELSPILEPLAPFRDRMTVLSGMVNREADGLPGEGAGDHSRGQSVFLTGIHPRKTEGPDIQLGISMDQIAARELGQHTQLASLELGLDANDTVGSCDVGWSCVYNSTISWRSETTPLPMETDPRAVFERLFGADTTDPVVRQARREEDRSILDSVTEELARFEHGLGPRDRVKLSEYLEAIRDIERRIQKAEEQSDRELPVVDQPAGVPSTFEAHAKVMFDLMALAYQADLTRVCTFLIGRELSNRTYPEVGVPEAHHLVSHHRHDPNQLTKLAKINTFHTQLLAHLLDQLQSTPDGNGTLLDHSMILYGGGIGDSDRHSHTDLPILVMGGGAGSITGGRHIRLSPDTPLMNLHVSLLDKMGVPVEQVGDSTGTLQELSAL